MRSLPMPSYFPSQTSPTPSISSKDMYSCGPLNLLEFIAIIPALEGPELDVVTADGLTRAE